MWAPSSAVERPSSTATDGHCHRGDFARLCPLGPTRRSLLVVSLVPGAARPQAPIEHGAVVWVADYTSAREDAIATRKPLLIGFQEVPG